MFARKVGHGTDSHSLYRSRCEAPAVWEFGWPCWRGATAWLAAVSGGSTVDLILVRFIFILFVSFTCFLIHPFGLSPRLAKAVGALLGARMVVFEWDRLRVTLKRLIGAVIGSILGIFDAYLFAVAIRTVLVH